MKAIRLGVLILPIAVMFAGLPAKTQDEFMQYQCGEGKSFEAQLLRNKARVKLGNQSFNLLPVDSRQGLKYSNGRTSLMVVDNQASIEVDYKKILNGCTAPKAALISADPFPYTP